MTSKVKMEETEVEQTQSMTDKDFLYDILSTDLQVHLFY